MPSTLIDHLRARLAGQRLTRRIGTISAVSGGRLRVAGLSDIAALGDRVARVDAGKRLVKHPVVALLPEDAPNAQMRAMMAAMGQEVPESKAKLEINPRHPLIKKLAAIAAAISPT